MRSPALGFLAALVACLAWFAFGVRGGDREFSPLAGPAAIEPSPVQPIERAEILVGDARRTEVDPTELGLGLAGELTTTDSEDPPSKPIDPHKEIRLNQLGMILEDYYEVGEIEKSSKLCALVSISVAVLLEETGRYEDESRSPTSLNLQEGVRTMSINSRLFRFTDLEFPEYWTVKDQHLSLPREAFTSGSYVVPPEIEAMTMKLVERAQSALYQ
jgi:hypothetical protein